MTLAGKRAFVIVNPFAGRGRGRRVWHRVRRAFEEAGVACRVHFTEAPRHATELAAQAAGQGWNAVVAVGGDGTVNEVVNGLLAGAPQGTAPPLGIVPAGSGNDFVKLLDLPYRRPRDVVGRLLAGRVRAVDVGRANGRYFTNGVGWGFDGHVALEAQRVRRLRGLAVYVWALIKSLRRYRNAHMRVEVDGEVHEMVVTLAAVANGACYGGGFWLCPHAVIDDGWLDVCVGEAMSPARILRIVPLVMRGAHVGQPDVHFFRGRAVTLSSDVPLPAQVDGEILDTALTRLHAEVVPRALQVLV